MAREIKRQISRERKRTNENKNNTESLEDDITILGSDLESLETQAALIGEKADIQTWLIQEPLSNKGLKAYIFDSMLKRVNHFLRFYKQYVGFTVVVAINLESANKDFQLSIIRGDDEVPYHDLSKGQKQLAKVVLCFAVNKTLQASKPLNILLMDELFESLDPDNVEVIGNILAGEAHNRSVHIITHHTSFNPTNCYKTFMGLNSKRQTVIEQKYKEA